MSELSAQQIKYLERFMVLHYVRYKDVQVELIDHFACTIEELLEQDTELNFELAVEEVYKGFISSGFAKIVREKEKQMSKFWRKHIWKQIKTFLKVPLLLITISIFSLSYFLINYMDTINPLYMIYGFLATIIVITLCFKLYARENDMNQFLFLKSYHSTMSFLCYGLFYVPTIPFNWNEPVVISLLPTWISSIIALYITFTIIISYIVFVLIARGLLFQLKSQYKPYFTYS